MSRIRANTITNQNANGAPNFPNGITVTGVVTATTGSQNITGDLSVTGNIGVGGTLTYEDVTNVDSIGVITARSDINVAGNIKNGTSLIDITQNGRIEIDIAGTEIVDINGNGVDVVGGVDITGTLKLADTIEHSGDSNTKIRFPATDTVSFETAGSERLRVGSSGQIGLGGANYGSSGQVLTSQGSGSAVAWTTLSSGLFSGVALLQDQKSSGTHGGQPPNTSQYNQRSLNTEVFDTGNFVSLSNNDFTLTAGTYLIRASVPAHRTNNSRAILYNVTDGSTVAYSQNVYIRDGAVTGGHIDLTARFTIGSSKAFDIRHRVSNSDGEGYGHASGYGDVEIYTQVLIFKEN